MGVFKNRYEKLKVDKESRQFFLLSFNLISESFHPKRCDIKVGSKHRRQISLDYDTSAGN